MPNGPRQEKLTAREITMAGALGAVILVIRIVLMVTAALSPYWWYATHFFIDILIGPVFMLLVARAHKHGALFLINLVFGLIMLGGSWMATVGLVIGGLLCELCLEKGRFGLNAWTCLGFFFFNVGFIGEFFPLWITKDSYLEYVVSTMGADYAAVLGASITVPVILLIFVSEIAGSLIGYFFGKKMMRKHFVKAGLA